MLEAAFFKTPDLDFRECFCTEIQQELLWVSYCLGTHQVHHEVDTIIFSILHVRMKGTERLSNSLDFTANGYQSLDCYPYIPWWYTQLLGSPGSWWTGSYHLWYYVF